MTDPKKSIFVQLYQPAQPQDDADQQTQPISQNTGGSAPEGDLFSSSSSPAEYMPIQEYVEPDLSPDMGAFIQNSAPQFTALPQIPLAPTIPKANLTPVMHPTQPLSDDQIEKELKTDVYTAIRWLAEWCLRQIKSDALNKKLEQQNTSLTP